MANIKICIVDDHPVYRKGLKDIINAEKGFEVLAECDDGDRVFEMIESHQPDILILDLHLPHKHGMDLAKELKSVEKLKIIILTMEKDEEMVNKAIDIGVSGYVLKESALHEIIESIKTVMNEQMYISPVVASYLVKRKQRKNAMLHANPQIENLTETERTILKYISENKSSSEIAAILFNSPKTVENHRANICKKLELHGSFSLLKFAIENKNNL